MKINEVVATIIFEIVLRCSESRESGFSDFASSTEDDEALFPTASVRRLDISHFPFLCELLSLSLDDMSFYVLAYMLQCKGHTPLTILEYEFVTGLTSLDLDSVDNSNDDPILRSSVVSASLLATSRVRNTIRNIGPGPAVDISLLSSVLVGLRQKIESCNATIRADALKCVDFYQFLYGFVLRHNEEEEGYRRELAVDLWRLFFDSSSGDEHFNNIGCSSSSSSSSSSSTSTIGRVHAAHSVVGGSGDANVQAIRYTHYRAFPRLEAWLSYVSSPPFYDTHYDEETDEIRGGHYISADLWQQLFFFASLPVEQYSSYDPYSAWPNAIDDFMAFLLNQE